MEKKMEPGNLMLGAVGINKEIETVIALRIT